jgi:glycosyltransferase involved in cell wall biosynthesis
MSKVSVLMPIYRTNKEHLQEAIESILSQTFKDFEFLILDDCPDDDRQDIIKLYKDERIKYFKNEKNLGITPSRNKLIDMAKGEYLAVMDHDDISLPTRFEKQVAYLDEHQDVGVVSSSIKLLVKNIIHANPIESYDIKMALIRVCSMVHPASMIRKSILTDNNIYYEERFSPAEDYALWCRLIPFTNFYNIPEVLFHYRDHIENTTNKQKSKMDQATLSIRSFVKVENPALYEDFLFNIKKIKRIKLFRLIPFLTIITQANRTRVYLFDKILLLQIKEAIELKGQRI